MTGLAPPLISVCIVTHARHDLLDRCLRALAAQRGAPVHEVLVAADRDRGAAEVVVRRLPTAHVLHVNGCTPGAARNQLAGRARGSLILYLDDDVLPGPSLLADLAEVALALPDVVVFGGPNTTARPCTAIEISQGEVLSSALGAGPVRHRFRPHPAGPADERHLMLCNLAVRRGAVRAFPGDLRTAEENAVLSHVADAGGAMRRDPRLGVDHRRRPTLTAFARQVRGWGQGRGQLAHRRPSTIRVWHVAPVLWLAYLLCVPAALSAGVTGAATPALLYLTAVIAWALRRPHRAGPRAACLLVLHLAYGLGVLEGVIAPAPQPVTPTAGRTD